MIEITSQDFIQNLPYWGYPVMFLLMVTEGTVITIVSAFLASLGYFNVFVVLSLSIFGDVISDIAIYYLGYFGGSKVLYFFEKRSRYTKSVVDRMDRAFKNKGPKIIFFVKSTTGLCFTTFLLAGASRMNFPKFLKFSILGGIFWSSFLVVLGYFFGYAAEQIGHYIRNAGILIFGIALAVVVLIIISGRIRARKFIKK